MFISISQAEKKEKEENESIAKSIITLRNALKSHDAAEIAEALHKYELPQRTEARFEYAIEWEILGSEKVALWRKIKELYYS